MIGKIYRNSISIEVLKCLKRKCLDLNMWLRNVVLKKSTFKIQFFNRIKLNLKVIK